MTMSKSSFSTERYSAEVEELARKIPSRMEDLARKILNKGKEDAINRRKRDF